MGGDWFDLRIRSAVADDADSAAEVWLSARHAGGSIDPSSDAHRREVREWFATVVVSTRDTWVIADDAEVVALMVLDEVGSISCTCVTHTERGLGSRLLEFAKERNVGGLGLWKFQSNRDARRFYERHGFVTVETTGGDNEESAPDVRYRRHRSEHDRP